METVRLQVRAWMLTPGFWKLAPATRLTPRLQLRLNPPVTHNWIPNIAQFFPGRIFLNCFKQPFRFSEGFIFIQT